MLIADSLFVYEVSYDIYSRPGIPDLLWLMGMSIMAAAAWTGDTRKPVHSPRVANLAVTLTCAGVAVGTLVVGSLRHIPIATSVFAGAALVVAVVRTALAFGDTLALSRSQQDARTDQLTGLANRRHFLDVLGACTRRRSTSSPLCMILFDLDRFKEVNDTFGHPVGDDVLTALADRLRRPLNGPLPLARLGGDEFGLLVEGDADAASHVWSRIESALDEAFTIEGVTMHISASAGIAVWPADGDTPTRLMSSADLAMYHAKNTARGLVTFERELASMARRRVECANSLRDTLLAPRSVWATACRIQGSELTLAYQPKVRLADGRPIGAEALMRWETRDLGAVPPSEFIKVAEDYGVMEELTRFAMAAAIAETGRWHDHQHIIPVSVNLSPTNLGEVNLVRTIMSMLDDMGLEPSMLMIEVTEDAVMANVGKSANVLTDLAQRGVHISLDDFGTGRSSLTYLHRLPVSELKIDRSLVIGMTGDEQSAAIVKSIIDLSHSLDITVVAEGVEDQRTAQLLRRMGADAAQGFYFAPPMHASKILGWWSTHINETAVAVVADADPGSSDIDDDEIRVVASTQ